MKIFNARRRWKLLANTLRQNSNEEDQFVKFSLIELDRVCDQHAENVYVYKFYDQYSVKIKLIAERPWTASELMGFNNTGNICVWPSEEALTYYILKNLDQFDGQWVMELGGGMTCLAGLTLAKYATPKFVHVTDGNELSIQNVENSLRLNHFTCTIKASVLKWESINKRNLEKEKYKFILCADCLFFDECRSYLINAIWFYLAPNGVALITAPQRGKTLELFTNECIQRGFSTELVRNYNDYIWEKHIEMKNQDSYNENVHYPILIKLYKKDYDKNHIHT